MAFTTDSVCLQDLADALQLAGTSSLASQLTNLSSRCHAWAYNYIVQALANRGYLLSQITSCDWGADVERDLTLWKTLSVQFVKTTISKESMDAMDQREMLKTMPVVISGVFTDPQGTRGIVSTGDYDTTNDLFVPFDPDDSRLGQPTRF